MYETMMFLAKKICCFYYPLILFFLVVKTTVVSSTFPSYCGKDIPANTIDPIPSDNLIKLYGNLNLIQVQILVRHGARVPCNSADCWKGYNTTWTCGITNFGYPDLSLKDQPVPIPSNSLYQTYFQDGANVLQGNCELGQLLDEGYFMGIQNGRIFREAYLGNSSTKLKEPYNFSNPSDFFFESSNYKRTITFGQLIINGMFPDPTLLNNSFNIIPWHTGDLKTSYYYPNSDVCPYLNKIENELKTSDQYKNWKSNNFNVKLEKDLKKTLVSYSETNLFDCLMTSWCSDNPLPNGLDIDLRNRIIQNKNQEISMLYKYKKGEYPKLGISTLVKRIRARMIKRASTSKPTVAGPRFVLYSGHDSTLMSLLASLGGSAWDNEYSPYGSHVALEMYATEKGSHLVRVLFQGKPVEIPGCRSDGICELQAFLGVISFSVNDFNCQVPSEKKHISSANWTVFFITLTLGCAIGGGLVYVFLKKENSLQEYQQLPRNDKPMERYDEHQPAHSTKSSYTPTPPKPVTHSMDCTDEDFELFGAHPGDSKA